MSKLVSIMFICHVSSFRFNRIPYRVDRKLRQSIITSIDDHESLTCLSFFKFFRIDNCEDLISKAQINLSELNVKGTLYVAREGINGQFAVPTKQLNNFRTTMTSLHEDIHDLDINIGDTVIVPKNSDKLPFRKLLIKKRNQVLTDKLDTELDLKNCGPEIEPYEWHEKVQESKSLVLDCRNGYEAEWGNFTHSIPLNTQTFSESWKVLEETLKDTPKDAQILTYCTGGIRCVKVNAFLKQRLGFTNVLRLKKGIIAYEKWVEEEEEKRDGDGSLKSAFSGLNYLFDRRRDDVKDITNSSCSSSSILEDTQ